jgi:hypothetical protein
MGLLDPAGLSMLAVAQPPCVLDASSTPWLGLLKGLLAAITFLVAASALLIDPKEGVDLAHRRLTVKGLAYLGLLAALTIASFAVDRLKDRGDEDDKRRLFGCLSDSVGRINSVSSRLAQAQEELSRTRTSVDGYWYRLDPVKAAQVIVSITISASDLPPYGKRLNDHVRAYDAGPRRNYLGSDVTWSPPLDNALYPRSTERAAIAYFKSLKFGLYVFRPPIGEASILEHGVRAMQSVTDAQGVPQFLLNRLAVGELAAQPSAYDSGGGGWKIDDVGCQRVSAGVKCDFIIVFARRRILSQNATFLSALDLAGNEVVLQFDGAARAEPRPNFKSIDLFLESGGNLHFTTEDDANALHLVGKTCQVASRCYFASMPRTAGDIRRQLYRYTTPR